MCAIIETELNIIESPDAVEPELSMSEELRLQRELLLDKTLRSAAA